MRAVVNGVTRDLPDETSVADVVAELVGAPDARGVAVAVDGDVVPRSAWPGHRVGEGDRIEVLTASQGG